MSLDQWTKFGSIAQAVALIVATGVGVYELVLRDRDAESAARQRAYDMLLRTDETKFVHAVNEIKYIARYPEARCHEDNTRITQVSCAPIFAKVAKYIDNFATCVKSNLCDREISLALLCPYIEIYDTLERTLNDKKQKPPPDLSYFSRIITPECKDWVNKKNFALKPYPE